jgi:hypothetical protein
VIYAQAGYRVGTFAAASVAFVVALLVWRCCPNRRFQTKKKRRRKKAAAANNVFHRRSTKCKAAEKRKDFFGVPLRNLCALVVKNIELHNTKTLSKRRNL